jgi:hypothetical protein
MAPMKTMFCSTVWAKNVSCKNKLKHAKALTNHENKYVAFCAYKHLTAHVASQIKQTNGHAINMRIPLVQTQVEKM